MRYVVPIVIFHSIYVIVVSCAIDLKVLQKYLELRELVVTGSIHHLTEQNGARLKLVHGNDHLIEHLVKFLEVLQLASVMSYVPTVELRSDQGV